MRDTPPSMNTMDDGPDFVDDPLLDQLDPNLLESFLSPYRVESSWSETDPCPECGNTESIEYVLELDSSVEIEPIDPARIDCEECGTILFVHTKWAVYEVMKDKAPYTPVE